MKTFFLFVAFLIFTSCHNGNTNVSTGNNTIIYDFPVTQIAESEKIDLEIIGINDLMVIDTLLFAFKASGYNDFFEMYSTDNWQYLGKFLSQGRGPDEFLSVQFSQDYFFKDDNLVLWISDGALQKRALLNITQSLRIGRTVCDTIFRITSDCSYFQVNDSMVLLQKYVPGNICLSVQNQHINLPSIFLRQPTCRNQILFCIIRHYKFLRNISTRFMLIRKIIYFLMRKERLKFTYSIGKEHL